MVQKNIVCEGLRCYVHSKSAFIDWCMEFSKESRGMLIQAMMEADSREGFFESSQMGSVVKMQILWDQEQKEHVFDAIIRKKLLRRQQEEVPQRLAAAMGPALNLDHEEVHVESILFLAYAVVRNEACRKTLMEYAKREGEKCYEAYKESKFRASAFPSWFLVDDRLPASMAVGLIERIRQEYKTQQCCALRENRLYKSLMKILEEGHRNLKNQLKKAEYIDGGMFQKIVKNSNDMVLAAAEMMVLLIMAEESEVPVLEDYDFYLGLQMLLTYEGDLEKSPELEDTDNRGRRLHRHLQKEHLQMESYYICYYLDGAVEKENELDLELVFAYFHLNLRMLTGIELEQKDVDFLCSLAEDMKWEDYKQILLTATLCKYIHRLQQLCEEHNPEERRYLQRRAEKDKDTMLIEIENLQSRTEYLEQKKKELEKHLEQSETEKVKLRTRLQSAEEKNALERDELISLRNYIFQCIQAEEKPKQEEAHSNDEYAELMKGEKMLIIGGHANWQKKMKQHLPHSQFLSSDNLHFDNSVLYCKKYLVFNTDMMKHGLYYKITGQRKKGQKILYVHGNNITKSLQELKRQIP
nr:hypothetical protein [uncultured Blautia sp.]